MDKLKQLQKEILDVKIRIQKLTDEPEFDIYHDTDKYDKYIDSFARINNNFKDILLDVSLLEHELDR